MFASRECNERRNEKDLGMTRKAIFAATGVALACCDGYRYTLVNDQRVIIRQ